MKVNVHIMKYRENNYLFCAFIAQRQKRSILCRESKHPEGMAFQVV
jgi:hypothetical protein